MLHLRRSALRLLSSSPSSFVSRSRTITSLASSPFRAYQKPETSIFQRRWASQEATQEEEAPISKLQPTGPEEVENAILEDSGAETVNDPQTSATQESQTTAAAETGEEVTSEQAGGRSSLAQAASAVASSVASAVTGSPVSTSGAGSGTSARDPYPTATVGQPKATLYIGNLFFDVTENDLSKEFSRFGKVENARLLRDSRGLSKGFGYLEMDSVQNATKAIEAMNQQVFEGRRLAVQYAAYDNKAIEERRNQRTGGNRTLNPPSKTLFIGNMSFEMTDRDLNNLFRGIRNVIDVRVAIDRRTGQPRGFAHADFIDVKSAMDAFKVLEGKETYGRRLRIDYSYGSSVAPKNQTPGDGNSPPPPTQ